MNEHEVDPKVLKKLSSVNPKIPYKKNGEIDFAKMPTKMFLVSMGLIIFYGVGMFLFVANGYGPGRTFAGVAINPTTKECAEYSYYKLFGTTMGHLPKPEGWQVYADAYAEEPLDVMTPYGYAMPGHIGEFCQEHGLKIVAPISGKKQ